MREAFLQMGASSSELYALGFSSGVSSDWSVQRFTPDAISDFVGLPTAIDRRALPSANGSAYTPDGLGGYLGAYLSGASSVSLREQHVDATGSRQPAFGSPGVRLDTLVSVNTCAPAALMAAGGGAWYAWTRAGLRMTRVDATGARLATWPDRGWAIPGLPAPSWVTTAPALDSDGGAGVLVVSADTCMRAQHLSGDMTVDPLWPAAGLPLGSRLAATSFYLDARPTLIRSDATHWFAIWNEFGNPLPTQLFCQRFSITGQLDPAWPASGLRVQLSGASFSGAKLRCLPDGSGGVTISWMEGTSVLARHVLASGAFAPGYETAAKVLAIVPTLAGSGTAGPQSGVAASAHGGLVVCWSDSLGHTFGRWYDGSGAPYPSPATFEASLDGDTRRDSIFTVGVGAAMADGHDGAYLLLWLSGPTGGYSAAIAHATQHGVASVAPSSPRVEFAAAPNPARGECVLRFTLPDEIPASVTLFDLTGRRIRSYDVRGAGPHAVPLDGLAALPPGLYLARLAAGGLVRESRVVILR